MRKVKAEEIVKAVERLCIEANRYLPQDVLDALKDRYQREESPLGKEILQKILENAEVAPKENLPLCQDTGICVFFVDFGQEVVIEGGNIEEAINEGVRRGYTRGYLRKSIVSDPLFDRVNTKDNTPSIIHTRIVPGNKIKIIFAPKGGGAENMSRLCMLKPADGVEGVKNFVVKTVKDAGPNPCPPVIVGVGVGGDFEMAAFLAKKALLRKVGKHNSDQRYAKLEEELFLSINRLGIGPQGFGGRITALWVSIEYFPCHIASLPVAVNMQCHSARHREIEI
ncbi:fumarate hydratase [Candidatus Aerophobetes bacterium]|nr:fumarate hydratase [Candidatus Aerophobetes bacterium]